MNQPTAIQKVALRSAMSKHSQILVAETGAGKSLAYLLPVINDIFQNYKAKKEQYERGVRCLVLVPTHELALQL